MECVKYGKIRKCCAEQTSGSGEGRIQRQGISEGFSSCDLQKSRCDYGSAIFLFLKVKQLFFEEIVEETVEDLKRIMGDFTDRGKTTAFRKNMTGYLWNLSGKTGTSQKSS